MKTLPIYVGTNPTITDMITDENGAAVDLTGDTVLLFVQTPAGVTSSFAGTINPDQVGHKGGVSIVTPGAVSASQSYWLAWWRVTSGSSTRDTDTFALSIIVHGQETPVPVGPCSGWIDATDVLATCTNVTDPLLAQQLADAANDVVYGATARQFKGVCTDTIRPTRIGCSCWGAGGISAGVPISWGFWAGLNMWAGGYGWGYNDYPVPQGCGYLSEYALSYPVSQILQIKVDGSVLDPSTYRVDEERMLVRLPNSDGTNPGWPLCQNMQLPDTQPGTWSVNFTYGIAPPSACLLAAKQLACQLGLAFVGAPCALPTGTTKVTRAGITIERGLLADWTKGGSTGLALVDAAIRAYNPNQLMMQSSVYSPDVPDFGRHVGS